MNDQVADTRIPIESFADFPTCRLEGATFGIRYEAAMEAIKQFEKPAPEARTPTIAIRGRAPWEFSAIQLHTVGADMPSPGAIGQSQLKWGY